MKISAIPMSILRARQWLDLVRTALVIAYAALGALLAAEATSFLQYRSEQDSLALYAAKMVDREHSLGAEAGLSILRIAADRLPPCSDADLTFLRDVVVASEHLRDMGRMSGNVLQCSALHGRLQVPWPLSMPDVVSSDGNWRTWNSRWPVMPSGVFGHLIESKGVWATINEQTLKGQADRPEFVATEFLYDRHSQRLMHSFGPEVPLSQKEILASGLVERQGVLFKPLCRTGTVVCVVVSEPVAAFQIRRRPLLVFRLILGGVFGLLIACIVMLLDFRQQSLEARLRRAIQFEQLTVVYQPIVDLQTETIVGAEALVRWAGQRDGRPIDPDVFIPLAESRGFVGQITRLVMRIVARELGDALRDGRFHVTLNVSAQDLIDPTFLPELERHFHAAGVPRSSVGLEVTERTSLEPSVAVEALATLKKAGYKLYIDDFGTGYSSLSYLHRLSVDTLKMDRIFTQTVGTGSVTDSVVPQILDIAKKLNLHVVVEGVETREQADYFRAALPGGHAQGWYFGRPVPASALLKAIEETYPPILYAS